MTHIFKRINLFLNHIGFDPIKFVLSLLGIIPFFRDLLKFIRHKNKNKDFRIVTLQPILYDKMLKSGVMKGHYFHQDLLVARRIYENNPTKHIDIGSRTDGFVAHLAVFREIEVFDIRSQESKVRNIIFKQGNLMEIPDYLIGYCDSVSSLHAIEHFGLGRYGDPIDFYGHLKAIENVYLMLKPGGKFYFSVPIGKQRIVFNAHRVFNVSYLISLFENKFKIDIFSYVDDDGNLHEHVELTDLMIKTNFNCTYGCGIFELTKLRDDNS